MSTRQRLIHHEATCMGCDATCSARNVVAWAHNHARRTGHQVAFETGFVVSPAGAPPAAKPGGRADGA
jgi:hypothetical protein